MKRSYEHNTSGSDFRAIKLIPFVSLLLFASVLSVTVGTAASQEPQDKQTASKIEKAVADLQAQVVVSEGVSVEFEIKPVSGNVLLEGEDAAVRFTITDAATKTPLSGLRPSAWMDFKSPAKAAEAQDCRQKVQSFLQASLSSRPDIDLNTYYILALNEEPTISVIDPLLGYGGSKLLTLVFLRSKGEDWVLSRDKRRLFVTMPKANQVAVVDTSNWRVEANIDVGPNPNRIVLQQDEKYIWVGNDAEAADSGVTVVDAGTLKTVARIETGAGHHEIVIDSGDLHAFVSNKKAGTLSVIDVQKLSKIKELKTGELPAGIAYSPLSKAVYLANEGDGTIVVIGGPNLDVLGRMAARPGLRAIRFVPDGRYGFVASQKENAVYVFDSSTNRIIHGVEVGEKPEKISFTSSYAYVWSLGTEQITMIRLASIGKVGAVPTVDFPGGQIAPEKSPNTSIADSLVAAPEGAAVVVGNPADKIIYYYAEGMAAPMGSFKNYGRAPRAVMVWDRNLREIRPGVYSTAVRLSAGGAYDVAFLLDSPRIVHCFAASWKPNPLLAKTREGPPVRIEPLINSTNIGVKENVKLQFRLLDRKTEQPKLGLKDVGVLMFLAPGTWQKRQWAQTAGEGLYEVSFSPPHPGVYYVFVQCPSLGVRYNQVPYVILEAKEKAAAGASAQ